jgi:hypothetical protein
MQAPITAHGGRVSFERRSIGQRLDRAQGEAPNVRPRPGLTVALRQPLLGSAVGGRERRDAALLGGDATHHLGRRAAHLADTEIQNLERLLPVNLGQKQILWLQVAVQNRQLRAVRPREFVRAF